MTQYKKPLLLLTLLIAMGLTACSKSQSVTLSSVGNEMKYDTDKLTFKAGTEVTMTLVNNANTPAMIHNFLIIEKGSLEKVTQASVEAGPTKQYAPDIPEVLVKAPQMTRPGKKTTFTFMPPAPGEYIFVCTYPGHASSMRGVVIVQ